MEDSNQKHSNKNASDSLFALRISKRLRAIEKLGGKCSVCGDEDHRHLDFHHLVPESKTIGVSLAAKNRWSIIEKEIGKCTLMCGNCHCKHHYKGTRNSKLLSKYVMESSGGICSRCKCKSENGVELDFHHLDTNTKKFSISNATTRKIKVSRQEIIDEISKCIVICRNCHKEEHFDMEKFLRLKNVIDHKIKNHKEIQPMIDKNVVKSMLESGLSQQDISRKLNASKGTISDIAKYLGLRKEIKKQYYDKTCALCGSKFNTARNSQVFCSKSCINGKVAKKPTKEEFLELLSKNTLKEIGEMFGVSPVSVFKWKKKIQID